MIKNKQLKKWELNLKKKILKEKIRRKKNKKIIKTIKRMSIILI
jgi:ribosomal protein S19